MKRTHRQKNAGLTPPEKIIRLYIGPNICYGQDISVYRRAGKYFAATFKKSTSAIILPVSCVRHAIHKITIIAEKQRAYGASEVCAALCCDNKPILYSNPVSIKFDNMPHLGRVYKYEMNIETRKIKKSGKYTIKICPVRQMFSPFSIRKVEYVVKKKKKQFKNIENTDLFFPIYSGPEIYKENEEMLIRDKSTVPKVSVIINGDSQHVSSILSKIGLVYPNFETIVCCNNGKLEKIDFVDTSHDSFSNVVCKTMDLITGQFILFVRDSDISPFLLFDLVKDIQYSRLIYEDGACGSKYIFVRREDWPNLPNIGFDEITNKKNIKYDLSFISCVNNLKQYSQFVASSVFNNDTDKRCQIIPILNFGNTYSAAQALNIGLKKAQSEKVVACHQDIIFYKSWVNTLFERIYEIEKKDKHWGIIGTAGITKKENTVGVVRDIRGKCQWRGNTEANVYPVQTLDEHCIIFRKGTGLLFDEDFDGFHIYSIDLCLQALSIGLKNYGIVCPLSHISGSFSMLTGKTVFSKYLGLLNRKWKGFFKKIITPVAVLEKGRIHISIDFKKED